MMTLVHRLLYRLLPLDGYLRTVSRLFFAMRALGLGRRAAATEYIYHLPQLVQPGACCIDIGANLGYYARDIARLAGPQGRLWAVEPVEPVRRVLERNLQGLRNVTLLPYALGEQRRTIVMENASAARTGYLGTGRHSVSGRNPDATPSGTAEQGGTWTFTAEMRRGSELFGGLERIDFIKCDVEGYELHIFTEMRPLLERHRPVVLVETGGANRPQLIALFEGLGYAGYVLEKGCEVPLAEAAAEKDIIFRIN